ncbi:MAG: nicotinate-nucleotide adenylyltransferase [Candidatus Omnitrophica bacterium]|nr:nicotinate-nucleotide adenylyltransferase [Candidatus Omnitrophota bacterium]
MKIGILGGTFNPIHIGHLILAQECWYAFGLEKVFFVPAYLPPHKHIEGEIPVSDRLNMVRLALEGDERFGISTFEIDKAGISYSIDTVRYFRAEYGEKAELYFLTGGDSAVELSNWKDPDKMVSEARFVIATRPGWKIEGSYAEKVEKLEIPAIDISSSDVRSRIKERRPIDHLVPSRVVRYIRDKGLYR